MNYIRLLFMQLLVDFVIHIMFEEYANLLQLSVNNCFLPFRCSKEFNFTSQIQVLFTLAY